MPAKDLGTKFTCYKCGTKFYDLKKPEVVCPKCGTDQKTQPVTKPSSRKQREKEPVVVAPEPAEDEAGEDEAEAGEEAAEDEDEDMDDEDDDG